MPRPNGPKYTRSTGAQTQLRGPNQARKHNGPGLIGEARIRSDALDALEVANQAAFKVQEEKMKKMMKDHEALMERDRRREDRKDAELQRQLDQEDLNEDD